jgi:hypothetical protein
LAVVLCVSALAVESGWAQGAADSAQAPQAETAPSPNVESAPGWLLGGRNRVVNPFRATPAPGTVPAQGNAPGASRPSRPGISLSGAAGSTQKVPPNATANALGQGWTCNFGFRRQGAQCIEVSVPENATIDIAGRSWTCNRGFVRQGAGCAAVTIPENASLDATGRRWACDYGFRREGAGCIAVVVPENASLDKTGHAWACNSGFQPRGQACISADTARVQQQAGKAVNAPPGGRTDGPPSVTIDSGENRLGRTNKARVVIGRF